MSSAALEQRLGYEFTDPGLLRRALSHRSWIAESDDRLSNERLEFLGDAVLGWVVADLVFRQYADLAEGALTDLRKSVVNAQALAAVARELDLGSHLLLGRGEDAAGGRDKVSILSDAMEAVLGAVYIDGGGDAVVELVTTLFVPHLDAAIGRLDTLDYKSTLQERLAREGRPAPEYEILATGPDHDKWFSARALVDGHVLGEGAGPSKKAAEQAAASAAFGSLRARPAGD